MVQVVDSNPDERKANDWAIDNLRLNMKANGLDPEKVPVVLQWNKRDLPDAMPVEELNEELNPEGFEWFEAVAYKGDGVFDTLKCVAKQVLRQLQTQPAGV